MEKHTFMDSFLSWRSKNISDRQLIVILSIFIGLAVGFAAVIIKNLVHFIQTSLVTFALNSSFYLYILYPFTGILLTVLFIRYINKRQVQHGIPSVLYSISKANGYIRGHNLYSSIITSALTVGFGGSVGLEGPTVATGAAIGSNLGRFLRLNYKQLILLLGCASAGAMSAIFKAPVAGIVFALEVLVFDLTMVAIVPLLISSATAALTSYLFLGQNVLYPFVIENSFMMGHIHYYMMLGIVTGFISVYFIRVYMWIAKMFEKLEFQLGRLLVGGAILGILVFVIPALFGEGYEVINQCLRGDYSYLFENTLYESLENSFVAVVFFFIIVIFMKVVAASVTFGSGGVGGIFAPSLFIGANAGLVFSKIVNLFDVSLTESNFALVGMAGMIAGVIHAPLTAIFLIAEITGGYQLFMPLIIVSTISYATIRLFVSNSVYTYQLAQRGELITHHKDKAVLMRLNINELLETDFSTVHPDDSLGDLIRVITHAHRNIFPVVTKNGMFRGIVKMDDIRHIMFNRELYDKVFARDLMFMPDNVINPDDTMEVVAGKFQESGRYNIAVIDHGKYLGFLSRAKVFSAYRKMLEEFSEH